MYIIFLCFYSLASFFSLISSNYPESATLILNFHLTPPPRHVCAHTDSFLITLNHSLSLLLRSFISFFYVHLVMKFLLFLMLLPYHITSKPILSIFPLVVFCNSLIFFSVFLFTSQSNVEQVAHVRYCITECTV